MDVCYAPCCWHALFFVVFHYVSSFFYHGYDYYYSCECCVLQYIISPLNYYLGPFLIGAHMMSGQHDVVLPWPLIPRNSGGVVGLATVLQQQPQSQMPFQAYANYALGPLQVHSFFRVEPPTVFVFICLVSVMVYAFCFLVPCWMPYSPLRAQPLGYAPLQPFGAYPWIAYVQPGNGYQPTPGMHWVVASTTALSRGSLLLLNQLSCSHSNYMVGHTALGALQRVTPSLHLPCMVGRVFCSRFSSIQRHSQLWTVVGIKPGDSCVVIGNQVYEFTHIWSAEQFLAHSHIYPVFTGKVSSLTHFPLEPECEDYSFLD